jgi:hypothetical protein
MALNKRAMLAAIDEVVRSRGLMLIGGSFNLAAGLVFREWLVLLRFLECLRYLTCHFWRHLMSGLMTAEIRMTANRLRAATMSALSSAAE